jgi:hypothetical protein
MLNSLLKKKTEKLESDVELIPDELLRDLHCRTPADLPKVFDDLNHKLQILQAENDKLDAKGRRMEALLMKRLEKDSEQISRIRILGRQNKDLEKEKELLESKIEIMEASLAAAKAESTGDSAIEYSTAIAQLTVENRTLTSKLSEATKHNESSSRKFQKKEQALTERVQELEKAQDVLKQQFLQHKQKAKRRLDEITKQSQDQIALLRGHALESEANLQKTLARVNGNCEQASNLLQEKVRALKETEQKCQQLSTEVSKLQIVERSLKSELDVCQNKFAKQTESVQGQTAAQQAAFESQIEELSNKLQVKIKEQTDLLYNQLVELLESEGVDRPLVKSDSFAELFHCIRLAIARKQR